jgi:hypothetical protein
MDIDLMNTKIWVNNDRELLRKIELLAFKQGFGWINRIHSRNGTVERCYQKHTQLKKVYTLYFGETEYNNKYITQISSYHKQITKDYTHLDRYNSVTTTNNIWCDDTYNSKAIIELFPKDIFKENTINLWI